MGLRLTLPYYSAPSRKRPLCGQCAIGPDGSFGHAYGDAAVANCAGPSGAETSEPRFKIKGARYVFRTHLMAAVPRSELVLGMGTLTPHKETI